MVNITYNNTFINSVLSFKRLTIDKSSKLGDTHRMNESKILICSGFVCLILFACTKRTASSNDSAAAVPAPVTPGKETVLQKNDRLLGIHPSEPQTGFVKAFQVAQTVGFDYYNLHLIWGKGSFVGTLPVPPMETNSHMGCLGASTYNFGLANSAHGFYSAYNKKLMITIGTIDTNNKFVPECLTGVAFDDATFMIQMFKYMLDGLFSELNSGIPQKLVLLNIGNEIDAYSELSTCPSAGWTRYKTFFDAVSSYAKTKQSNLQISVTGTYSGLIDPNKVPCFKSLLANADVVSVTYYPMDSNFKMKSPDVVYEDFKKIVDLYPDKPIYFQEAGYSSGSQHVSSSVSLQAQFIKNVFKGWDKFQPNIKAVSFLNLHEWSQTQVDGFGTQYQVCPGSLCSSFKEYLQTLGLRTFSGDGTDKESFQTLKTEASKRGWVADP